MYMIYQNCFDILPSDGHNEYTKREKTGEVRFDLKTFICQENAINKFKRLSINLMENKKEAGMSVNKYKTGNVNAKEFR